MQTSRSVAPVLHAAARSQRTDDRRTSALDAVIVAMLDDVAFVRPVSFIREVSAERVEVSAALVVCVVLRGADAGGRSAPPQAVTTIETTNPPETPIQRCMTTGSCTSHTSGPRRDAARGRPRPCEDRSR